MRKVLDISAYQGTIDFAEVKTAGVEGIIVRGGYRGYETATLIKDDKFDEYMVGAISVGLSVGAYYVSQAINEEEAREEARFLVDMCKPYNVTDKLAIDVEWAGDRQLGEEGRANKLTPEERTNIINAFADEVRKLGYEPMCYANRNWFNNYITPNINCPAWVAHYFDEDYDLNKKYTIPGYDVCGWQYSSTLKVNGIERNVDHNVMYYDVKPVEVVESIIDTKYHVGDFVEFESIYVSSTSTEPLTPLTTSGTITEVIPGRHNPYLVGVIGWVNDNVITTNPHIETATDNSIKVGDKVKVINAVQYRGKSFEVYYPDYEVYEVNGDRAVIGVGGIVTTAINVNDIEKV